MGFLLYYIINNQELFSISLNSSLTPLPLRTKNTEKTYSFYLWFGREQNENKSDLHDSATVNPEPPYYYVNNIDAADLKGELNFMLNELFQDETGDFNFENRKYGINVVDKWLITYKPGQSNGTPKLGEFESFQNTVIGPISGVPSNGEGHNCRGSLNDGNNTNYYPLINNVYNASSIKNPFVNKNICINNKGEDCNDNTSCQHNCCATGQCGFVCPGASLLKMYDTDTYDDTCNIKVNVALQNTMYSSIVYQQQDLEYNKENYADPKSPNTEGVYLTSLGDCINLPTDVYWNKYLLDKDKIPTKCNGSYSFNCSDTKSNGFNEFCFKRFDTDAKSKLRIDTVDPTELNDNEYFAQYVGSIRLDDLSNGSATYNDACRVNHMKKLNNIYDIDLCNQNNNTTCNSDIESPFWNTKTTEKMKSIKENYNYKYNFFVDYFSNDDNYCSQKNSEDTKQKWFWDSNSNLNILAYKPQIIYTISSTGEFIPPTSN